MAMQLDEFVNTQEFKDQACADQPELSGHVLTVAGRLGAYFGPVNNLVWASVFLLEGPILVFLLKPVTEPAEYKEMYQTFFILTGCDDGADYFTYLL